MLDLATWEGRKLAKTGKERTMSMTRRDILLGGSVALGALGLVPGVRAQDATAMADSTEMEGDAAVRRNIAAFRTYAWQDHFPSLAKGAILCDTQSRALHFWAEDGVTTRLYPTSVPLNDELTRLGRTEIVRMAENPPWRPTPSMRERNPEWPEFVAGGDPMNPLGVRGMYLGWQYYLIHGTHDTRKIGRRSSNGCIGLYNEHIAELFNFARVGTQVLLI
jgi:L,D-transpeptidase ErfK/SrfK